MKLILGIIILTIYLAGAASMFVLHREPTAIDLDARFQGPSFDHILGTDDLGRDLVIRVLASASTTIIFSIMIFTIPLGFGTGLGLISVFSNNLRACVNFLNEILITIPDILLIFLLASFSRESIIYLILIISITYVPYYIKIVQSGALRISSSNYLLSLHALGLSEYMIIVKHILPQIWPSIAVQTFYNMGNAVLVLATLGFLGIGLGSSRLEWGSLISSSLSYMHAHPLPAIVYSFSAITLSYSFNLIGESLRKYFDRYGQHN